MGLNYAQAVTSGTAALKVGLEALQIKPGDEVITQSFTFVATVEAIIECGALPILIDINETLNMDPMSLKQKISKNTKAVIPVHMYGASCQMDEIMDIAKQHNLMVLEDTAQALGGLYKGRKLGTIGTIGTFSFDFGKALTTGEGGMITTKDKEIYLRAREFADHGHESNPAFPRGEDTRRRRGFNYRMMEIQGAIGLAQLKKLDYAINKQRDNKKNIKEGIRAIGKFKFRTFADESGETGDTMVLIFETIGMAKEFVKGIREKGLGTKNLPDAFNWHFAGTWNHIFSEIEYYKNKPCKTLWKKSEDVLRRTVALPININMSSDQVNMTISTIREVCKKL